MAEIIPTIESLLKMKLHESIMVHCHSLSGPKTMLQIIKIVNGWIYIVDYGTTSLSPVFVPENDINPFIEALKESQETFPHRV